VIVKVIYRNFTEDLTNTSSQAYKNFAELFINQVRAREPKIEGRQRAHLSSTHGTTQSSRVLRWGLLRVSTLEPYPTHIMAEEAIGTFPFSFLWAPQK
jgi:hypothetical protein